MMKIETKSGNIVEVNSQSVRKSVRSAHELIERGLPGAVQGAYAYSPETDSIIERATGKSLGKLNRE
jgi:hypothetical protein